MLLLPHLVPKSFLSNLLHLKIKETIAPTSLINPNPNSFNIPKNSFPASGNKNLAISNKPFPTNGATILNISPNPCKSLNPKPLEITINQKKNFNSVCTAVYNKLPNAGLLPER